MDPSVESTLIQGDNLSVPSEEEEDALNTETFGNDDSDNDGGLSSAKSNSKPMSHDTSTVEEDKGAGIEGKLSGLSMDEVWMSPQVGNVSQGSDILSSSPFAQFNVWNSPKSESEIREKKNGSHFTMSFWGNQGNEAPSQLNSLLEDKPKVMTVSEIEQKMMKHSEEDESKSTLPPALLSLMNQDKGPPTQEGGNITGPPPQVMPFPPRAAFPMPYHMPHNPGPEGQDSRNGPPPGMMPSMHYTPLISGGRLPAMPPPPGFLGHRLPDAQLRQPLLQFPPTRFRPSGPHGSHGPHGPPGPLGPPGPHDNRMYPHYRRRPPRFQEQYARQQSSSQHMSGDNKSPHWRNLFMSRKEKEKFMEMALLSLQCKDDFKEDYYYKKYLLSKEGCADVMSSQLTDESKQKLVVPEVKKEERRYLPVEFEGALGKVTKCSVTSPRKTLEILKSTHTEEVEVEREMNTQQKRRRLLLILEKMYDIVLEVEDIDYRRSSDQPTEEEEETLTRREELCTKVFNMIKVKPFDKEWTKSDDKFFLQIMFISKGKRLLSKALPLFKADDLYSILLAILRNMTALVRRDQSDEILPELTQHFSVLISNLLLPQILESVTSLAKGPPQANPPRPALVMAGKSEFGTGVLNLLIKRGLSLSSQEDGDDQLQREWDDLFTEIKDKLEEFKTELKPSLLEAIF